MKEGVEMVAPGQKPGALGLQVEALGSKQPIVSSHTAIAPASAPFCHAHVFSDNLFLVMTWSDALGVQVVGFAGSW